MAVEVRIPQLGESVTEGVIARWLKRDGDSVQTDDPLLELETDKAAMEIPAPAAGRVEILAPEGASVSVGAVVGRIVSASEQPAPGRPGAPPPQRAEAVAGARQAGVRDADGRDADGRDDGGGRLPAAEPAVREPEPASGPAVRKLAAEQQIDLSRISGTGKGGRVTKGDVLREIEERDASRAARPAVGEADHLQERKPAGPADAAPPRQREPAAARPARDEEEADDRRGDAWRPAAARAAPAPASPGAPAPATTAMPATAPAAAADDVERVPMTPLRRRIAQRLLEAQRGAAILTTFNEIDLAELVALRKRHRERFRERHGVDLGLMSLFGRAAVLALAQVPVVNARIDGDDVVYHRRVHLGIAVSTPRGLVVPVVRNADRMSFAELERAIAELARVARDGKLTPDQLSGGTFTITNGGIFGSLLSTPILNPPQSGILGMHKIQERPVAVQGQVVIRPMMYVALSYDHRLVDGEQAVTFLVRVKEQLEDPTRMLLEV